MDLPNEIDASSHSQRRTERLLLAGSVMTAAATLIAPIAIAAAIGLLAVVIHRLVRTEARASRRYLIACVAVLGVTLGLAAAAGIAFTAA